MPRLEKPTDAGPPHPLMQKVGLCGIGHPALLPGRLASRPTDQRKAVKLARRTLVKWAEASRPRVRWVAESWPGSASVITVRSEDIRGGKATDEISEPHRFRKANGIQIMATLRGLAMQAFRPNGFWCVTERLAGLALRASGFLEMLGWRESAHQRG